MKRTAKVLLIIFLSVLGAVLLAFAVFMAGVSSAFDSMNEKTCYDYSFDIPESDNKLIAREWFSFSGSGIDFYLKSGKKEKRLGSVTTNEYCPFGNNDYLITWRDNSTVDITYGFDAGVRKTVTLETKG